MKKLFENVEGNQFKIAEFSSNQPEQKPAGGDAIKEFLEIMADMPTDEPPPLKVWQIAVSGAKDASENLS